MESNKTWVTFVFVLGLMVCTANVSEAAPMGTAWTYQGRLMDTSVPADGPYDLQFRLFDDPCTGTQQGSTIDFNDLDVIDGHFTVELDFGSDVFNGDARWLETTVAQADGSDPCTLRPRIEIAAVPYALQTHGIFVDDAGNVGIGNLGPAAKLDVSGGIRGAVKIDSTSLSDALPIPDNVAYGLNAAYSTDGGGMFAWYQGVPDHTDLAIWYGDDQNADLRFLRGQWNGTNQDLTDVMTLSANGNVGIGTTNPIQKLDVQGTIRMSSATGPEIDISAGAGYNQIYSHDGDHLVLNTGGSVGIGVEYPRAKLEVAGTVLVSKRNTPPVIGERYTKIDVNSINAFSIDVATRGAALRLNDVSNGDVRFAEGGGNVGIGTSNPQEKLDVVGRIRISNSTGDPIIVMGEGLDYAEGFDVSAEERIEAGSVLVIDADNPGKLVLSNTAYDRKVAGIVAGGKGLGSGVRLGAGQFDCNVALAGRVYCKVEAAEHAVQAGDLLTTSTIPGYAMKATDYTSAQGAILGKAMESLEKGKKGQILVLVTLQ